RRHHDRREHRRGVRERRTELRLDRPRLHLFRPSRRLRGRVAALAETKRVKLDTRAAASGTVLNEALAALRQKHEIVGDVRGKGLMAALELVADRGSKKALDEKCQQDCGCDLRCWRDGARVRQQHHPLPPLIITADDASIQSKSRGDLYPIRVK